MRLHNVHRKHRRRILEEDKKAQKIQVHEAKQIRINRLETVTGIQEHAHAGKSSAQAWENTKPSCKIWPKNKK
jgi:hypothetical protein